MYIGHNFVPYKQRTNFNQINKKEVKYFSKKVLSNHSTIKDGKQVMLLQVHISGGDYTGIELVKKYKINIHTCARKCLREFIIEVQ